MICQRLPDRHARAAHALPSPSMKPGVHECNCNCDGGASRGTLIPDTDPGTRMRPDICPVSSAGSTAVLLHVARADAWKAVAATNLPGPSACLRRFSGARWHVHVYVIVKIYIRRTCIKWARFSRAPSRALLSMLDCHTNARSKCPPCAVAQSACPATGVGVYIDTAHARCCRWKC